MHVLIGFGRISASVEFKEIELSCFPNVCMFSFDIITFFCPKFVCVIGCFVFNVYWVLVWVFILVVYMYGLIGLDMFLVFIGFVIFSLLSIVLLFFLCVLKCVRTSLLSIMWGLVKLFMYFK